MTLAAVLCCAMVTTVFTACGDDDDNSINSGKVTDNSAKATGVSLSVSISESVDILEYCDVVIEYNDGTGTKTEAMSSSLWSKTFTATLPNTFTIKKIVTLKADKDMASATSIKYSHKYSYSYYLTNASGSRLDIGGASSGGSDGSGKADKVAEGITNGRMNSTYTYTFDSDGNLTLK